MCRRANYTSIRTYHAAAEQVKLRKGDSFLFKSRCRFASRRAIRTRTGSTLRVGLLPQKFRKLHSITEGNTPAWDSRARIFSLGNLGRPRPLVFHLFSNSRARLKPTDLCGGREWTGCRGFNRRQWRDERPASRSPCASPAGILKQRLAPRTSIQRTSIPREFRCWPS